MGAVSLSCGRYKNHLAESNIMPSSFRHVVGLHTFPGLSDPGMLWVSGTVRLVALWMAAVEDLGVSDRLLTVKKLSRLWRRSRMLQLTLRMFCKPSAR